MDVDCCRNVRISNCYVNSPWTMHLSEADHALDPPSRPSSSPSPMLRQRLLGRRHASRRHLQEVCAGCSGVSHTGRIKFGTESDGGFRNITISNCVFEVPGTGLESVDGAILEDITVTNISMRDIASAPIFLRLGNRMRAPEGVRSAL